MKKLFICFALMFFFAFPLGSANTNKDKSVLKHGQLKIENVIIPNFSSLNLEL